MTAVLCDELIETPCALCGSEETAPVLTTANGFYLSRCVQCDFQYYNPRPSNEAVEAYYHGEEFYQKVNITAVEIVMDILAHHKMVPGNFLDIGCGIGALVSLAEKKGWNAVGVDPSPMAGKLGKEVLGVDIVQSYVNDLDFPEDQFDAVVMLAVLEHAFDPLEMVRKVWKWIKPGGRLILSTPNLDNLNYHLLPDKTAYSWFIKEHINHFTIKTHRQMLDRAGFENTMFHLSGHFSVGREDEVSRLNHTDSFLRSARKHFSESLNEIAFKRYTKPACDLNDDQFLDIWLRQVECWDLPSGEYSLSDAVYVSAQKPFL